MTYYFLKRLALIVPTLFGILLINFIIIQSAPGGPVEQMIAKVKGTSQLANSRLTGGGGDTMGTPTDAPGNSNYQGSLGLDPEFIKEIEKMYGFDQPATTRFWKMLKDYLSFEFGESYFKQTKVLDLIQQKLPVSISLGLWSTLLIYLISIPLGIRKAVRDGSRFDGWTSAVIIVGYAVPSFLFALILVVLFAGGSFWSLFPLRGLTSDHWMDLSLWGKIKDYAWHLVLPITAIVITGFANLTLLTKNSFLEEIHKQYVTTARAKGVKERNILYGHVFRNAMLIVVAGLPATFVQIFFTSALLIEIVFSLDGLGQLAFESALSRDYPVMFGSLYIFTLVSLFLHLVGDMTYRWVDPRIDFEKRLS